MQKSVENSRYMDPDFLSRLSGLDLIARTMVEGFLVGLHKSPYHGYNVEFSEHRPYIPGDDIRSLDWKVWAKSDKLYVKRYEAETNMTGYIMLDVSGSMEYGRPGLTKLEYGAYLAAGLAYLMIRQQDAAALALFRDGIDAVIEPRSTFGHLARIYAALDQARAGGATAVGPALNELADNVKRRGMAILISDLHDEPDAVIAGLKRFRHRNHDVILFHLLHADEVEFPFRGPTQFQDMETGERIKTEPRAVAADYRRRVERARDELGRACALAGVDYCPVDTSQSYDRALYEYLSRRRISSR